MDYDYKPYTYIVRHKETGYFYYGCKFANDGYTHPELFWNKEHKHGYFTSSKLIHKMIDEYGIDAFEFEVRKVFDCPKSTFIYEQKVIKRIIGWEKCLNAGVGGSYDCNKPRRIKINGISCYDTSSIKMHSTKLKVGEDGLNVYQRAGLKQKNIKKSKEHIEKIRNTMLSVGDDGLTLAQRNSIKNKGDNNPSKKTENKIKISNGVKEYMASLDFEEKERQRIKHLEAMQSDEVRKKISDWNKLNNPVRDTNWYNDGKKSYRLIDDDPLIKELSLLQGRLSFNMVKKESTCPYCGLVGKGGNMKRYHFENCKNKKEIL